MTQVRGQSEATRNFCKALGLDPSLVKRIDMHMPHDDLVTITATLYVSESQLNTLALEVKRYNLVEDECTSGT